VPRWPSVFAEAAADAAAALRDLERWLLPASCLLCGEPVSEREGDPLVCALCRLRWRPVPHPVCGRCGQPQDRGAACLLCQDWPAGLSRVRSAVWLDGSARAVAHRLKYDGWWRAADAMADAMVPAARGLEPLTGQVSLVPIPLGARRQRDRGYNQSERLAAALGRRLGLPVRPELLTRARETRSQTALTPEERRANVEGAFEAAPAGGLAVILVDDVFTTGATLVAAAGALIGAGVARVEAVTFARATAPVASV
jgi:ComF family protein